MKESEVHAHLDVMMDRALSIFKDHGFVITTSWASGPERIVFGQPIDEDGLTITTETRIGLHALMAITVSATLIGRVDETYTQERDASDPPVEKGELNLLADFDPSIQTAICVEAFDIDTATSYLKIARLTLDDDGRDRWDMDTYQNVTGQLVHENMVSALLAAYSKEQVTMDELEEIATEYHWEVADADLIHRG